MTLAELELIKNLGIYLADADKECDGGDTFNCAEDLFTNLMDKLIEEKLEGKKRKKSKEFKPC